MKQKEADMDRIDYLIDRYFEATATEAEERELRRALASAEISSPRANEARAVMGYFAAGRSRAARRKSPWVSRAAAAAVAAVVCGAAAALFFRPTAAASADQCIAYVGDTEITDRGRVLAMMQSDLARMGEASQALQSDVASELLTLFNSVEE